MKTMLLIDLKDTKNEAQHSQPSKSVWKTWTPHLPRLPMARMESVKFPVSQLKKTASLRIQRREPAKLISNNTFFVFLKNSAYAEFLILPFCYLAFAIQKRCWQKHTRRKRISFVAG
jgi:hypothetical protein